MHPEMIKLYLEQNGILVKGFEKENILNKMENILKGCTSTEDKAKRILKLSEELKKL